MAPTPVELRDLWVSSVRRICCTDQYFLGRNPKWPKIFQERALWLEQNPDVVPIRFVEAQIHWCLRNRVRDGMWPTLLSGPKAVQRYREEPDEAQLIKDIAHHYETQARAFIELSNHVGVASALLDTMGSWSPLYLAYVRYTEGMPIPQDLRASAAQEAQAEYLTHSLFPIEFIRSLT